MALVLLAVLAASAEDLYGYEIAKRLQKANEGEALFKEGTVYPVLRALSAAGLLTSRIVPSYSGPPRRYYRITEEGRTMLARSTATSGGRRATSSIASLRQESTYDTAAPRSIDAYLKQLRDALAGQDPALIQDAAYDAEEYLRAEIAAHPDKSEADVLELIASTYGEPGRSRGGLSRHRGQSEGGAVLAAAARPPRDTPSAAAALFQRLLGSARLHLGLLHAAWRSRPASSTS